MAKAPQQLGIGIRRHFTSRGVHPYDTVEWERRDARIPNFKDGGDAFFQAGVEFPTTWSVNATNIVAQKYFRGTLGLPEREVSLRQVIDRVADTITDWGVKDGYFVDDDEAQAFRDELKYVLVHQRAAFNSPVWFNIGVNGVPQQASACFILSVDDTMDAILNWYREEGIIFKGGSGAGVNLSRIRSSKETLQGGGTASGPVSFMRGADASAGTIKSGGKTRRAAKMVILDADHPDIEDFIWCKAVEERKARALRDAGFDMDLDGKDSHSIQYQNANNSVRVTEEFMQAVVDGRDWQLKAVKTGEPIKTMKARELMHQIAQSAWECADPGMQFDTTINKWHTAKNTGRINASNPCFTGDSLVHTDKGLVRFADLLDRARRGETFGIYTHDATNPDAPAERLEITRPEAIMITGWNEVMKLRFNNGMELSCTAGHKIFTVNRGYVEAKELTAADEVKVLTLPAPATAADWKLPASARRFAHADRGDNTSRLCALPEKWTPELAHYLGWLVGDGCISGDVISTVYASAEEQAQILPAHRAFAAQMNDGVVTKPSVHANGTVQLRQSRRVITRFFDALGVSRNEAAEKVVPEVVYGAPSEIVAEFLRGLFDADGCVHDGEDSPSIGLSSASRELLVGVQRLLSTFGVFSRISGLDAAGESSFEHTRKDGTTVADETGAVFDLRIASRSIARFAEHVGFSLGSKQATLEHLLATHRLYETKETVHLVERADDGVTLTYNLSEPRNHSYIVNGTIVRNCSEYMHLDNSACNLASINLLTFLGDDDRFDVEGYKHTIEVVFTAQEILVGNADYPTEPIAETSRQFRQLGLGYANLGALLMALGMPYDSDAGRAYTSALTAVMTGHAYATSARIAARMGPFAGYADNEEPMLDVLRMHRDAATTQIDEALVPAELAGEAHAAWNDAVKFGEQFGVRNSQASVIAPTGTIALMMDCDTTGIEPDLALTKAKKLVGGGTMFIVNQTVPRALRNLGYGQDEIDRIVAYIDEQKTIVGAPALKGEHLPVFACSMGDNVIHYMGHIRMMGAVQPWISGAISKTANMPEEATIEDVEELYIESWRLGLKAVALYRDNCKVGQPLSTQKKAGDTADPATMVGAHVERIIETVIVQEPVRQKLPRTRTAKTFSFRVADCHGYATIGEYEDGRPGELFLQVAKGGSTLAGIMDAFAISVSHGLQYGVPLEAFVEMFTNMRFEPAGMTDDPDIRFATSLVDYIFRRMAVEYLSPDKREALGILTVGERLQPTLPGVEESTTPMEHSHELPPEDRAPSAALEAPKFLAPTQAREREVVLCHVCGDLMQRAGSCYACPSCGSTSGCS